MNRNGLFLVGVCATLLCGATPLRADVYTYTDEQGVLHLTDNPPDARYQLALVEPKPAAPTVPQVASASAAGASALAALIQIPDFATWCFLNSLSLLILVKSRRTSSDSSNLFQSPTTAL